MLIFLGAACLAACTKMAKRSMRGIKNRIILQVEIAKIRFFRLIPIAWEIRRSSRRMTGEVELANDGEEAASAERLGHVKGPFPCPVYLGLMATLMS